MAKATVELTCTNCQSDYTKSKTCHSRKEANNWESYMDGRHGLCPTCYKAFKATEKATAASSSIATIQSVIGPLPTLSGTYKQVDWASSLRSDRAIEFTSRYPQFTTQPSEASIKVLRSFFFQAESKFWIDQRNDTLDRAIQKFM